MYFDAPLDSVAQTIARVQKSCGNFATQNNKKRTRKETFFKAFLNRKRFLYNLYEKATILYTEPKL
jgi:siderophore synthetase component